MENKEAELDEFLSISDRGHCDNAAISFREVRRYIPDPDIAAQVATGALLIDGRIETTLRQTAMYFKILAELGNRQPKVAAELTYALALRRVLEDHLARRS